jgi:hypothetical protein
MACEELFKRYDELNGSKQNFEDVILKHAMLNTPSI